MPIPEIILPAIFRKMKKNLSYSSIKKDKPIIEKPNAY
jgi:hypothetical protein